MTDESQQHNAPAPLVEVVATHAGFALRFRDRYAVEAIANELERLRLMVQDGELGEPPYLFLASGVEHEGIAPWFDAYADQLKAERQ